MIDNSKVLVKILLLHFRDMQIKFIDGCDFDWESDLSVLHEYSHAPIVNFWQ